MSIDLVIFDKTGTLTRGRPVVADVRAADGLTGDEVLRLAAAVEADSEHPLARAVVEAGDAVGLERARAEGFEALPGLGVRARVDGRAIVVGGPRLTTDAGAVASAAIGSAATRWASEGRTVLFVVEGTSVLGAIAVEDEVRPESAEAVRAASCPRRPGRHDHRRQPGRGGRGRQAA